MKMRKTMVFLCILAALLCLCSFEGRAVFRLDDQWGGATLTDAECSALSALAAEQTDRVGDTDFLVVFASDWDSDAKTELRRNGYSSANRNVIGLVIWYNGSRYETELYTYGDMSRYISDESIAELKGEIDADATTGRPYAAAQTLIVRSAQLLAEGKAAHPTKTNGQKLLTTVVVGVAVGIVAGGVAVLVVVLRYRKKNRSASYPLGQFARLTLTLERDIFLYHTVTKTAIPTSSGGGSSGRSSGGGRSSGRS